MSFSARDVWLRALLIGLFLAAYILAWRPVRDWTSHTIAGPLLTQIDTPRSQKYIVDAAPARAIEIRRSDTSSPVAGLAMPTGLLFAIGSVFLLVMRPARPYWIYLGAYQIFLGAVMLGLLGVGIGWANWGFTAYEVVSTDIYRGTSLGLPLVLIWSDIALDREKGE